MIVGEHAEPERLRNVVQHSLDRKVCNTLNTICVLSSQANQQIPIIIKAAKAASSKRQGAICIHATQQALGITSQYCDEIDVISESDLAIEYEWEDVPEFAIVVVESLADAVSLCNTYSPHFVVSVVSTDNAEVEQVWKTANAPFVGDGFTRWVDGQFALLRPELGLSNWQYGRLLSRGGVISGDSLYTIRLKATQQDSKLHR